MRMKETILATTISIMTGWTPVAFAETLAEPSKDCTISGTAWGDRVHSALDAFKNMNQSKFLDERKEVLAHIQCLTDVVDAETVARFHHMELLAAFARKDKATLGAHARAANNAAPHLDLSGQGLVNDGHPIAQWNNFAVSELSLGTRPLPLPKLANSLYVDGIESLDAPTDLPYIFQRVVDGLVVQSEFVPLGDAVPAYPIYEDPNIRLSLEPTWTWVSVGATGVAVASAMLAHRSEQRFWSPATDSGDLISLQRRTNVYSSIAIVMGLTSVGAVGTAAVLGAQ